MFSSLWGGISSGFNSLASGVYNTVNSIGSGISNLFSGGGNQSANVISSQGGGQSSGQSVGFTRNPAYSSSGGGNGYQTASPSTISAGSGNLVSQALGNLNAGQQGVSYGGGSSYQSASNLNAMYGPPQPKNISASNLGFSRPSYGGAANSISTGSTPTTLPTTSASYSLNPRIDNTGMAGGLAGYYTRNADGTYTQVKDTQANPNDQIINDVRGLYNELGVKPTVAEDPKVIQARSDRQRIQRALQSPMAELNAITAKQNQDLLQLRQTGSKEGVTEAVYGGQSNAINYNAAIRALPLQAQVSALQGDLKLAQDYLSELTQVKQDQIDNQYAFKASMLKSIEDKIDKKDQRTYEALKTANDRAYQESRDNIKYQDDWQMLAAKNGDGGLAKQIANLNPSSPNFRQKLGELTGGLSNSGVFGGTGTDNLLLNAVYNVNAGSAEGQQKRDIAQVQQLVNSGQTEKAKALLMSRVVSKMSAGERSSELDRRNTIDALETMQSALNDYANTTGNTNIIRGGVENIANKIGTTSDPKLASIKARIIQATQKYRNAITGAAWGEQEDAEYRSIFPSISNTSKLNDTIITTMLDALKSNERNAVGLFLGGTDVYDGIWGSSPVSGNNSQPEITVTPDDNALFNSIVIPRSGTPSGFNIQSNNPLSGGNLSNSSPFFRLFR